MELVDVQDFCPSLLVTDRQLSNPHLTKLLTVFMRDNGRRHAFSSYTNTYLYWYPLGQRKVILHDGIMTFVSVIPTMVHQNLDSVTN